MKHALQKLLKLLVQWEWLWYVILLPILLFPSGWRSLALMALPLLWLLRALAAGRFFPRTPLNVAILAMAVMLLVSLYAVFDIELSFPKIAGLVLGMALFFTAVSHAERYRHGLWHVVGFVLLSGTGIILIGAAGTKWTGPFAVLSQIQSLLPVDFSNLPGTVGGVNGNQLAGVINWIAPLSVALLFGLWKQLWRNHKLYLLVLLGISGGTVAILPGTFSRGGLASFGVSLLVMLALAKKWGRWVLGTAVILGIVFIFTTNLGNVLTGAASLESGAELGLEGRLEIWSRAIYGLEDFPFTGMSMNGFRRVVHILYPLFLVSPDTDIAHAHNQLLQAGLDLGLPGLVAYLALWLLSGWLVWVCWRQARTSAERALAIGLAGALTGGWFFGILDAIALGARPGFVWWLLLALIVALHKSIPSETFDSKVKLVGG